MYRYFYEILTDEHLSKSSNTRILVVCNKQDIDFAKGETLIQTSLEKEM
jgi:signal recognition particle receptor subunit beta